MSRTLRAVGVALVAVTWNSLALGAAPLDAGAVRQLVNKLDLRAVELPAESQLAEQSPGLVRAVAPLSIQKTYDKLLAQLIAQNWQLLRVPGSPQVTAEYAQAFFEREGCQLSLSLYPENAEAGTTNLTLHNTGPLDTRKLPRLPNTGVVYESRPLTILSTTATVPAAALACRKQLRAAGWQEYGPADATVVENAEQQSVDFRCGPVVVSVFIGVAPAQGGKTTLNYSSHLLENELPWPADVAKADFSEHGPTLRTTSSMKLDELVRWYGREMKPLGFEPNAGWIQVHEKSAQIAYKQFSTPQRNLLLRLATTDEGTKIDIEAISSETLVQLARDAIDAERPALAEQPGQAEADMPAEEGAEVAEAPKLNARDIPLPANAEGVHFDEEEMEITLASETAIRDLVAFFRKALVGETWKENRAFSVVTPQAGSFELEGPGGASLRFLLINTGLGDGTSITISVSGMSMAKNARRAGSKPPVAEANTDEGGEPLAEQPLAEETPAEPAPTDEPLQAEDKEGLPVPTNYTSFGTEKTPFRRTIMAATPAPLAKVVDFYREHLVKAGWKEDAKIAEQQESSAHLVFTGPSGTLHVRLNYTNDETQIELATRSAAAAKKAGILPKPGQARVIFGNPGEKQVKVTLGGKSFTLKAGTGAKKPDGPSLDLKPGKYKVKVEAAGEPAATEEIEVSADGTWAVMVGTELGVLALQVY